METNASKSWTNQVEPATVNTVMETVEQYGAGAGKWIRKRDMVAAISTMSLQHAETLLAGYGNSLTKISQATVAEIVEVSGAETKQATRLLSSFAIIRVMQDELMNSRPRVTTPADVADLLREEFRGREQEEFHVLMLDPRHNLLRDDRITIGLADRSQVHAREVFRNAIRENACRVILAHNHPSGDPAPSPQDVECTRSLVAAGKIPDIEVIDHVIIGSRSPARPVDFLSMKEVMLM